MKGKVVVITGATSGIGQVAAEDLANMGARIVPVARERGRGQAALKRLGERSPQTAHSVYYADLSRLSEMKQVASEIAAAEPRVDVLINNAGAIVRLSSTHRRRLGAHLRIEPYGLLRTDARAAGATGAVGSGPCGEYSFRCARGFYARLWRLEVAEAYRGNFLESLRYGGPGFKVYGRSKLCNTLFTREQPSGLRVPR